MSPRSPDSRPTAQRRRAVVAAAAIVASLIASLLAISACSFLVSTNDTQCQQNSDCTRFGQGVTCDPAYHVCVAPSSSSSSSSTSTTSSGTTSSSSSSSSSGMSCSQDGGIDGGGCWSCAPVDNATLLNACETGCTPFNNATRLTNLLDGGGLPPLPDAGPDAGM